jgi:hypothetical protein
MSAYRMRKTAAASSAPLASILIAGSAVAALGTVLVVGPIVTAPPPEPARNAVTGCLDTPITVHKVAALDLTDAVVNADWDTAVARIGRAGDSLPPNGKLTVLRLNPADAYHPVEIFSKCTRGKPTGTDTLTQTASFEMRLWQSEFAGPLQEALDAAKNTPPAVPSPIMEMLVGVTWRSDFQPTVKDRELILVSDLVQHDPRGYSQLRCGSSWKCYTKSAAFREARPDLRDVRVEVLYINRPAWRAVQTADHVDFWRKAFVRFGTTPAFAGAPTLRPDPVAVRYVKRRMGKRPPAQKKIESVTKEDASPMFDPFGRLISFRN